MNTLSRHLLAVALTCSASQSFADALGVYAGAGIWQAQPSGYVGQQSVSVNDLNLDDDSANFMYIALEHPIPLIPNVRLQQTNLEHTGNSIISSDFHINSVTFNNGDTVSSDLDLTHQDAVLYYEFLDNWVNLDLGVSLRRYDGSLKVASTTQNEKIKLNGVLPMLYGKAQFDLPFSGWSIAAEGNGSRYDGDKVIDYNIKIAYQLDLLPLVDLGIEAGYRDMSIELEELDDLEADLTIDGPYAAVTLHF